MSKQRNEIIRLLVGGAVFTAGMLLNLTGWQELAIFSAAYVIVGGGVVIKALKEVFSGHALGENFLMSVASIGAFFVGEYPEAASVMLFYMVGELFQDMAVARSRKSIADLMDIKPDYANLKIGAAEKRVSPEEVRPGDIIVVKPGEKIPLDGIVLEGESMVDTSALTGEAAPRALEPGAAALSGFINLNGVLTIKVTKVFGESTVSAILDLVQNASSKKAATENFITKFARYYTPAVVSGAFALAVIPPLITGEGFSVWIYRALVFLVISCPCALVISIPLGFFGGIGGAAKRGILVKGSNYLEALNSVETVVFDKTGTLTKGVFKVTEINPQKGFSAEELLEYAAYAESYSNHPIALSILSAYKVVPDKDRIEGYEEVAGKGIKVRIGSKKVVVGNAGLMESENIKFERIDATGTAMHIAVEGEYAGNIIISDEIKDDAASAIGELKSLGINKIAMLTGDSKATAEKVGRELGIKEIYAELLPTDKVKKLKMLQGQKSRKGKLAFIGDGINDAPVLARADIGIAMGGLGSDAAIEAADIVIMTDEPSKIASAIRIAKRTRSIVYQNIVFALGTKAVFLVLGAFGMAVMWEAVFADIGVALLAILNAMRVMNTKNI